MSSSAWRILIKNYTDAYKAFQITYKYTYDDRYYILLRPETGFIPIRIVIMYALRIIPRS